MQGSGSLYSEFSNAEVDFKAVTVHFTRAIMEHKNGKPDVLMVLMKSRKHANIWLVISIASKIDAALGRGRTRT